MEQGDISIIGDAKERMRRAYLSLDGLSIGDCAWQRDVLASGGDTGTATSRLGHGSGPTIRKWPSRSHRCWLGSGALSKTSWRAVLRNISTRGECMALLCTTSSCRAFATGRIGALRPGSSFREAARWATGRQCARPRWEPILATTCRESSRKQGSPLKSRMRIRKGLLEQSASLWLRQGHGS